MFKYNGLKLYLTVNILSCIVDKLLLVCNQANVRKQNRRGVCLGFQMQKYVLKILVFIPNYPIIQFHGISTRWRNLHMKRTCPCSLVVHIAFMNCIQENVTDLMVNAL